MAVNCGGSEKRSSNGGITTAASSTFIINADDFGLSASVNAGIRDAHLRGILTSATLLANGPGFDQAVDIVKATPTLGVGVHLNLVRGKPLSRVSTIPYLLGENGFFRRFRYKRFTPDFLVQAELEYRAQIEKVLAAGIRPDHVDFEKHHAWQAQLYCLADRLAQEYGIGAIRTLREPVVWAVRHLGWPGWQNAFMAGLLRAGVQLRGGSAKSRHPDYFLGQTHIGRMDENAWLRLLACPPEGICEIMTHPGLPSSDGGGEMGTSWLESARAVEYNALVSDTVAEKLRRSGVRTIRFSELAR